MGLPQVKCVNQHTDKCDPLTLLLILDAYTRKYNNIKDDMRRILTTSSDYGCDTLEKFLGRYGLGMLKAYGQMAVTMETDRDAAVTAVACAICSKRFKSTFTAKEMLQQAWVHAVRVSSRSGIVVSIGAIDPSIPEGKRLMGLGAVQGTPIIEDDDGQPTSYKTADGKEYDTKYLLGKNINLSYRHEKFYNEQGQSFRGFVCNTPSFIAEKTGTHLLIFCTVSEEAEQQAKKQAKKKQAKAGPARVPAIVSLLNLKAKAGPPAAEEVTFA